METYPYPPESEESEDATYPQIGMTVQLLDTVIYFEEPTVARWDTAGTVKSPATYYTHILKLKPLKFKLKSSDRALRFCKVQKRSQKFHYREEQI